MVFNLIGLFFLSLLLFKLGRVSLTANGEKIKSVVTPRHNLTA